MNHIYNHNFNQEGNMKNHFVKNLIATIACGCFLACEESTGPETPLPPLQKWSFSGNEINYQSGIAVRRRDLNGNLTTGLTVWLTDQSIDCSTRAENLSSMRGGWIGIHYPEVSLGKGQVRLMVGNWPIGGGLNGNIDVQAAATLSKADTTTERRVSGSLDFHEPAFDPEDPFGAADIEGSFAVPYCPEE
jgi:hypothetical protein